MTKVLVKIAVTAVYSSLIAWFIVEMGDRVIIAMTSLL